MRICGTPASRIDSVQLKNVTVKLDRWTKYPGGVYDNRPTKVLEPIEKHATDGISLRCADNVVLDHCTITGSASRALGYGESVRGEDVSALAITGFSGESPAHPIQVR